MTIQQKITNADTLANEFKCLRDFQKLYFKNRDRYTLEKCKIQERKVDKMIDQYLGIKPLQGQLW